MALNKAHQWASEVGLTFFIAKTKAVIFSRHKNPPTLPTPLLMNGIEVEVVEEFKYLGLILGSHLEWTSHITHKIKQAKKHFMMFRKGIGTTWGPSPAITLWMYTGIVRPALTYGAVVWAKKACTAGNAHKLKKIQRLGMLMIAPMRRRTPTEGLEVILNVPPLELIIQHLAINSYNHLNLKPRYWSGKKR
jgi:hypothetical protein